MANKIQKDVADKVLTNTRAQGVESSTLHIQNRSIANQTEAGTDKDAPSDIAAEGEPNAAVTIQVKHKIVPPQDNTAPERTNGSATQKFMDTKPAAKKAAPAAVSTASEAPDPKVETDNDVAETPVGPQLPIHTKESDAAEANKAKRTEELEVVIENRKYFLPINTVAMRRSIKVSITLTIVVFLLSLVLLDFLLDTGTILLLQKIPHTHFFSDSSSNHLRQ
jgi:hypothetical protein